MAELNTTVNPNPAESTPNVRQQLKAAKKAAKAIAPIVPEGASIESAAKMPALPKLPRMRKAKAPKRCACGCGDLTRGGRFIPGHDAKLNAWALRVERGIIELSDIDHDGIRAAVAAHLGR